MRVEPILAGAPLRNPGARLPDATTTKRRIPEGFGVRLEARLKEVPMPCNCEARLKRLDADYARQPDPVKAGEIVALMQVVEAEHAEHLKGSRSS